MKRQKECQIKSLVVILIHVIVAIGGDVSFDVVSLLTQRNVSQANVATRESSQGLKNWLNINNN